MTTLNQLLVKARQGDAPAIEALVSKFSPLIEQESAKFGILQQPELSHSDLFQEVALRVWTRIDQFNGVADGNSEVVFEQWVRSTARSVLNNLVRAGKTRKRSPPTRLQSLDEANIALAENKNHNKTASSIFALNEEVDRLHQTIEKYLDPISREILKLRIIDGLSIKDISQRLSLTYEQVRYNYHKSLAELERRLA